MSPGRETKSLPLKTYPCQVIVLKFRKSFTDLESQLWDGSLEQRANIGLPAGGGKGTRTRPTANVSMLISWTHNRTELGCSPKCICYTIEVASCCILNPERLSPRNPTKGLGTMAMTCHIGGRYYYAVAGSILLNLDHSWPQVPSERFNSLALAAARWGWGERVYWARKIKEMLKRPRSFWKGARHTLLIFHSPLSNLQYFLSSPISECKFPPP